VEREEGAHAREGGCENLQEPRGNFVRRHEIFPLGALVKALIV